MNSRVYLGTLFEVSDGEAFEIVKAVQKLRAAQSQNAVFKKELAELRLAWKAKRNFMKLLAAFD